MDDVDALRQELWANGAFLTQLSGEAHWDTEAFNRLELAMRRACVCVEDRDELPRWLVEAFWVCVELVPGWVSHLKAPPPREDYDKAIKLWSASATSITGW